MQRLSSRLVAALVGCVIALGTTSFSLAQTVTGCGTTTIAKAAQNDRVRLKREQDCFTKAVGVALTAAKARADRLAVIAPAPTPVPLPTATPTPVPGTGDALDPQPGSTTSATALPIIASNFDRLELIEQLWCGEGGIKCGPKQPDPIQYRDEVGAFRFMCKPSHESYDDPLVFPRQPGKSHLHQYFGNNAANAYSTYDSLRTTGDSTCGSKLNRSAYWIPAMLNGRDQIVRPEYTVVYYKRYPKNSERCQQRAPKGCVGLARGLRMIAGFDMITGKNSSGLGTFTCSRPDGSVRGRWLDLVDLNTTCQVGDTIDAGLSFGGCWDGRLDSPDHRSHISNTAQTAQGERCPDSHPYMIPSFFLNVHYLVLAGDLPLRLSSDEMRNADGSVMKMRAGSTMHGDWFGAWDDITLQTWQDNCIDRLLNCSGGDLGDGTRMRDRVPGGPPDAFPWEWAIPERVPIPARPS